MCIGSFHGEKKNSPRLYSQQVILCYLFFLGLFFLPRCLLSSSDLTQPAHNQNPSTLNSQEIFLDGIAVIINDEIITMSELFRDVRWKKASEPEKYGTLTKKKLLPLALEEMIDQILILQEIKQTQFLTIPKQEVDKKLEEIALTFDSVEKLSNILKQIHYEKEDFFLYVWSIVMVQTYIQQKFSTKVRVTGEEITNFLRNRYNDYNIKEEEIEKVELPLVASVREKIKSMLITQKIQDLSQKKIAELRKNAVIRRYFPVP